MSVDAAQMAEATQATGVLSDATAAPTEATAESTTNTDDAFWARLAEVDPDEVIRRSPKVQGKVGALAQQQTQKAVRDTDARYQTQIAEAREATRVAEERATRRRLAEQDPDALAAKILADTALEEYQENQTKLLQAQRGEMSRALADRLDKFQAKPIFMEAWTDATPEQKKRLDWTQYKEIDDFFEAAAEVISDHRSEKKADALATKRLEAMRKEGTIEGIKADAAAGGADLNLDGMSAGSHIFSEAEIKANIGNSAWRKANIAAINQQAAAGLIRTS